MCYIHPEKPWVMQIYFFNKLSFFTAGLHQDTGVVKTTTKPEQKWGRQPKSTLLSPDMEIQRSLPLLAT